MKAKHWFAIAAGVLLLTGAFLLSNSEVFTGPQEFVKISAIVLFGLGLTITLFAVLAIVYSFLNLDDGKQALGLPDGSVRALLAFSLVLIFVCLAVFLYSRIDDVQCQNCGKDLSEQTQAQIDSLKKDGFIVTAEPMHDKDGKQVYQQIPGQTAGQTQNDLAHPLYNATYYPKGNPNATDFAKQIFTTLATIFVSVVSFYFGSSATTSAVKAAQGPGGDKTAGPLQTALTNALADSHNAQALVDQKTAALQKATHDRDQLPESDPGRPAAQAAVQKAQSDLDAANADLLKKQAAVQQSQKSLNDAQAKSGASPSPSAPSATP